MRRHDVLRLKQPISLRTASRVLGGHYLWWRKMCLTKRIRAQQLGGHYWFVDLAEARRRIATEPRYDRGKYPRRHH